MSSFGGSHRFFEHTDDQIGDGNRQSTGLSPEVVNTLYASGNRSSRQGEHQAPPEAGESSQRVEARTPADREGDTKLDTEKQRRIDQRVTTITLIANGYSQAFAARQQEELIAALSQDITQARPDLSEQVLAICNRHQNTGTELSTVNNEEFSVLAKQFATQVIELEDLQRTYAKSPLPAHFTERRL